MNRANIIAFCLSTLLTISLSASGQEDTQKSVAIYFRPYNVVWANDTSAILKELGNFITSHKWLSTKLTLCSTLLPEGFYRWYRGDSLPKFYPLFERTNPTGELKELALNITIDTKQELPGTELLNWFLEQQLPVYCITDQLAPLYPRIKQRFTIFEQIHDIIQKEDTTVYSTIINQQEERTCAILVLPKTAKENDIEAAIDAGFKLVYFDKEDAQNSIAEIKEQINQLIQ